MNKTKKLHLRITGEKIRNLVISDLKQIAGAGKTADPCSEGVVARTNCTARPN